MSIDTLNDIMQSRIELAKEQRQVVAEACDRLGLPYDFLFT